MGDKAEELTVGIYPDRVLVANRGEVAVRVLRTLADLAVPSVTVYAADDDRCLHVRRADQAVPLPGAGVGAYLDQNALIEAAHAAGATAVHPGWGFLSENAEFARRCAEAGLVFVGPAPQVLRVLGDKTAARAAAESAGIPVVPATGPATFDEAAKFLAGAPEGIMLKAVAGGGGRGMRRSPTRPTWPPRSSAAGPRRSARSATAPSTPSSCSPAAGTSRCRSSATAPARPSPSATGTAASSGAGRRWWNSPRRPD